MIPSAIVRLFTAPIRSRGRPYFQQGDVTLDRSAPVIRASVLGTMEYDVLIDTTLPRWRMRCTCPYAEEYSHCKHMWAVLLAADAAGLLPEPAHSERASSESVKGRQPEWQRKLSAIRSEPPRSPRAAPREWPANRRIRYELNLDETAVTNGLVVDVVAEFMRDAGRSTGQFEFGTGLWLRVPDADDRMIAHMLLGLNPEGFMLRPSQNRLRFIVPPLLYGTTMRAICDTGRCIIASRSDDAAQEPSPLRCDVDRPWSFAARMLRDHDGSVRVEGVLQRDGAEMNIAAPRLVTLHGLMVVDNTLAMYDYEGAWGLVRLLRSGDIRAAAGDAQELAMEVRLLPGTPRIELPPDVTIDERWPTPVPQLRVEPKQLSYGYREALVLEVSFDYDGLIVGERKRAATLIDREARRIVHRNPELEAAAHKRLHELGARGVNDWRASRERLTIGAGRLDAMVRTLIAEGWQVSAHGKRYRTAERTEVSVTSGIDWFDLAADITFGDQRVAMPQLLRAVRKGENTIVLDDGTFGVLPQQWLERYAPIIVAGTEHGDTLRFTRAQTLLLDALLASMDAPNVDDTFRRIRDELHDFNAVEAADPPPTFRGQLRAYQREGLGWMQFLRRFGLGGCLADDMGLGKTVQVLALLEERRAAGAGPSLVVVPKSLVFNWQAEAARFTPDLRVRDYTGDKRRRDGLDTGSYDVLITTYGTLRRDAPELKDIEFEYVILDEAQAIKNANTASAKAARLLRGRHRLAMSGTPIENRVDELWSLFEFLNPGMLGAASVFSQLKYAGNGTGSDEATLLARALRPFMLRRTKEQVAPELPPRTEQTVFVELEGAERKLYDELREHYRAALLARVDDIGIKRAKIEILEALLRLRQAACHPALIDKKRSAKSSSKLDVLIDQLKAVIAEGHKALVFSQFTTFLAIVRTRLEMEGIPYEYLDGRTRDRQSRVERFQADMSCPVFLISLKAGGYGLNLTAADYVFVLDPWWNPAVEAQAIDRTHRIGQDRHVVALRLIARDTVEEKVLQLQQQKRELADAILAADAGGLAAIGRDELALLLG